MYTSKYMYMSPVHACHYFPCMIHVCVHVPVHFHYSMFSETVHGLPTAQFVYLMKSVSIRSLVFTCVHVPVHVIVVACMCLYIHVQGVKKKWGMYVCILWCGR